RSRSTAGTGSRSRPGRNTTRRCSPTPRRRKSRNRPELAPRPCLFARLREQRRFVAAADTLGDLVGVILARGIAPAVAEAEAIQTCVILRRGDGLDRGPLVMTWRQVEADRPAAAATIVAVTLPKRRDLLLLRLVPLEGPGADISGQRHRAHDQNHNGWRSP